MDRIDLHVEVPALAQGVLSNAAKDADEASDNAALQLVSESRKIMYARAGKLNAHLTSHEVARDCPLSVDDSRLLDTAMDKLGLSARGYFKILKVARTIADLSKNRDILPAHLVEALAFRRLDSHDSP
jgi:magnesium chelatase family protein